MGFVGCVTWMFSCLFVILMMMVTISASHSARACYSVVLSETFLGPPVEDHVSKDAQLAEPSSCFRTPKDNQPNSHTERHLTERHDLWPKMAPARAPPHYRLCLHTHGLWPLPGSATRCLCPPHSLPRPGLGGPRSAEAPLATFVNLLEATAIIVGVSLVL